MKRTPRRKQSPAARRPEAHWWTIKLRHRSGRMPLTLLPNAASGTLAFDSLNALAASWQATRPCYAITLRRLAQQLKDGTTSANYILAHPEKPTYGTPTETTISEITVSECVCDEGQLDEIDP